MAKIEQITWKSGHTDQLPVKLISIAEDVQSSVTRWLDCFSIFDHDLTMTIGPNSKICQKLNMTMFCKSGEILQNLVTLDSKV